MFGSRFRTLAVILVSDLKKFKGLTVQKLPSPDSFLTSRFIKTSDIPSPTPRSVLTGFRAHPRNEKITLFMVTGDSWRLQASETDVKPN